MLFHVEFSSIAGQGEDTQKRALQVFGAWQPPEGIEFMGFYGRSDGRGGYAIVEVDTVATLTRVMAPFTTFNTFEVTPIMPIEEATGILAEGIAFRDSVS